MSRDAARALMASPGVVAGSSVNRMRAMMEENTNTHPDYANTLEASGYELFQERPSEFGTSMEPQNRRERGREIAAHTNIRRGRKEFRLMGREKEFESFRQAQGESLFGSQTLATVDRNMTEGAIPALFDLLSIGNYTTTGAVDEFLRTGSAWEAFKQAGIEFGSALPGIEFEAARKLSFSETDLPRLIFGEEIGHGRWTSAGIGLVMDVVLDPLFFVPMLGGAKLARLGGKALEPGQRVLQKAGAAFKETRLGTTLNEAFIHEDHKLLGALGKVPSLMSKDQKEIADTIIEIRDRLGRGAEETEKKLFESVRRMFGHLEPHERAMLGMLGDKPHALRQLVDDMVEKGTLEVERSKEVMGALEVLVGGSRRNAKGQYVAEAGRKKGLLEKLWKSGNRQGFLDEAQFREFFFYGVRGSEGISNKTLKKVFKERGIEPDMYENPSFRRQVDRLEEAFDTEFDISKIMYKRLLEHHRWTQSRKFIRAIMSDERIAMKVKQLDPTTGKPLWTEKEGWDNYVKMLKDGNPGYDVLELTKAKWSSKEQRFLEGSVDITGAYMLPKQIVQAIKSSERAFRDPDLMSAFMSTVGKWTSLWRGYATFSVGFHTRNMLSMFFNNWLAGLGTSKGGQLAGKLDNPARMLDKHMQALRLQIGEHGGRTGPVDLVGGKVVDGKRVDAKQVSRPGTELREGSRTLTQLPEWVEKALGGLGYKSIDDIAYPKIRWPKGHARAGKVMTPVELIRTARRWGVMQTATKIDNTPIGFERVLMGAKSRGKVTLDKESRRIVGGDVASDIIEHASDPRQRNFAQHLKNQFNDPGILRWNRSAGAMIENNGRLALWLDRVEKGASFQEARRATTMWHYDYRKLTDWERRYMRVLIPFYAWMRFNTPNMLRAVVKQPEKLSRLPKLLKAVEGLNEFTLEEDETPDYFDELIHAQLPIMRNGKPLFVTPDLPIGEIGNLNRKDLLSSMHPFVKGFFEDIPSGGANFFTGAPLERFSGELDEDLGVPKRALHVLGTVAPPIQKAARIIRDIKRSDLTEFLLSEYTGTRFRPVDVRRATRGSVFREEALVRQFRQKIRQEQKVSKRQEREEKRQDRER